MSAQAQHEPFADNTTKLFLKRTETLFADNPDGCDFTRRLQFYAFDVIGEITYTKRLGFIEKNEDIDVFVAYLSKLFLYVAPVWFTAPLSFLSFFLLLLFSPFSPWRALSLNHPCPDRTNPHPRPAVPQEPRLPQALAMGVHRLDIPGGAVRAGAHGRAAPGHRRGRQGALATYQGGQEERVARSAVFVFGGLGCVFCVF